VFVATTQFTILRADGTERLVVLGELLADDDPVVLADAGDADGSRQAFQLVRKVA
jgi:hypothetical protein